MQAAHTLEASGELQPQSVPVQEGTQAILAAETDLKKQAILNAAIAEVSATGAAEGECLCADAA